MIPFSAAIGSQVFKPHFADKIMIAAQILDVFTQSSALPLHVTAAGMPIDFPPVAIDFERLDCICRC